jgi:hypothetical protein
MGASLLDLSVLEGNNQVRAANRRQSEMQIYIN